MDPILDQEQTDKTMSQENTKKHKILRRAHAGKLV